jgi:hypothetical protein
MSRRLLIGQVLTLGPGNKIKVLGISGGFYEFQYIGDICFGTIARCSIEELEERIRENDDTKVSEG